jgi:lipopolysaccharide transport system ATP-binding protein
MSSKQNTEYAIEVSNLGKSYQMYERPSDRLKQMLMRGRKQYFKEFWALKGVSFQIKKGETVGIIGRNGSGKSTLLQMICGTLNPTEGEVKVSGRVAALLELGAGFNPEFTGVENVYMAASLYGLSKEEIDQRFDAIIAFADIGEHLFQPVKTYSSGMYVRLAFAVIAHVDADILVVDEALAVGDAVFTQKCMRFIRKFKESGTLLFVSHDMGSVLNLCERAVWLHGGQIRQMGQAKNISEAYLQYTFEQTTEANIVMEKVANCEKTNIDVVSEFCSVVNYETNLQVKNNLSDANGWKTGYGEITSVDIVVMQTEGKSDLLQGGEIVKLIIKAIAHKDFDNPILGFSVKDRLGQELFGENTLPYTDINPLSVIAGDMIQAQFVFKLPMLPNGSYTVMTSLANGTLTEHIQHHWLHDSLFLNVVSSKVRWGLVGIEFKEVELLKI